MKKVGLLITDNLELPCVILPVEKPLFNLGREVLVYCQNRLVKGYMEDDNELVAEIEIVSEFCIIPDLDEFLKETKNQKKNVQNHPENWI